MKHQKGFKMKNIAKGQLRTGMTVKLKGYDGLAKVVFGMFEKVPQGSLIGSNGEHHATFDAYDNNLNRIRKDCSEYTIEKVWDVPNSYQDFGKPCTDSLVFSRECEMTVAEIEKELGLTNLKIVK